MSWLVNLLWSQIEIFLMEWFWLIFSTTAKLICLEIVMFLLQLVLIALFWRGCMWLLLYNLLHMSLLLLLRVTGSLSSSDPYSSLLNQMHTISLDHASTTFFSRESYPIKMRYEPFKWKFMGIKMSYETLWLTCAMHNVTYNTAMSMCILIMDGHFLCPSNSLISWLLAVLHLIHRLHWLHFQALISSLLIHWTIGSTPVRRHLALLLIHLKSDLFLPFLFDVDKKRRKWVVGMIMSILDGADLSS